MREPADADDIAAPEEIVAEGSGPLEAAPPEHEHAHAHDELAHEHDGLAHEHDGLAHAHDELAHEADVELTATATATATADGSGVGDAGDADAELAADAEPELPAALDDAGLAHLVEALVFAADKPLTIPRLRQLTRVSDVRRIEAALATLAEHYQARGIALQHVSGGYQMRTESRFASYVQELIAGRPVRLSRAQLETLAIIAYRQPITRPEIDDIRGVDSSGTLRVLLERELVRVLGKKEEVGRPMLYGTTKEFLDFFSLSDLRELPTLREYAELTEESRAVMHDRLAELEAETRGEREAAEAAE